MNSLPPELNHFASLLDALPQPDRALFHYCLCLLMVEAGKMTLTEIIPGDSAPLCVFETVVGEQFSIPKPALTATLEEQLKAMIREVLAEEGPDMFA